MKRIGRATLLCAVLLLWSTGARGQNVAVKTNLLYDIAAFTVNAGIEVGLAPRWTLDASANYNGWTLSHERRWKHWLVQPEARYWFCDRFMGHFVGFHTLGGQYNVGGLKNGIRFLGTDFSQLSAKRYQGWFAGAGVAYGHSWILGRHWNFEGEIGIGWIYTRYDVYPCASCGRKIAEDAHHNYFGPTKAALNLIYSF